MAGDTHTERLTQGGDEILLGDTAVLTRLDKAIGWARKFSIFPYPFATACCAMEYMSLSMTPYDIDRFGALLPRFTPRQADLLMVIGTVTVRQGPILRRVFEQMAEPKWVMAFGACASTGGFYDNYSTLPGIDRIDTPAKRRTTAYQNEDLREGDPKRDRAEVLRNLSRVMLRQIDLTAKSVKKAFSRIKSGRNQPGLIGDRTNHRLAR